MTDLLAFSWGYATTILVDYRNSVTEYLKKQTNPYRFVIQRNVHLTTLDDSSLMDSSGEPVSKYRVKVFVPGRQENILFSGAPTYLGHRSLFFEQQF
jgi:hypothetical protein